jgi:hypothetical protein
MDSETNRTTPKWYQMPRWRWTGPGGYYGGFFSGVGLGLMLLALAVIDDFIQPNWNAIFAAGAAILVISSLVFFSLEGRREKKDHRSKPPE